MRLLLVVTSLLAFFSTAAHATVEGWDSAGDPQRVCVNFSSNHGYIPNDLPYRLTHLAEVLNVVRLELIKQHKLENLPIVVRYPDRGFTSNDEQAHLWRGKTSIHSGDEEELSPAHRYEIYVGTSLPAAGDAEFYRTILALIHELPQISKDNAEVPIKSVKDILSKQSAAVIHWEQHTELFDPVWSPDSNQVIYTAWQGGKVSYFLLSIADKKLTKLENPDVYMAVRPLWSPESRYLAYGDLKTVRLFDTDSRKTVRFPVGGDASQSAPNDLAIEFTGEKGSSAHFQVAFDTSLFFDYATFAYSPQTGEAHWEKATEKRPVWARKTDRELALATNRQTTSPNGQWRAIVEGERLLVVPVKGAGTVLDTGKLTAGTVAPSSLVEVPLAHSALATPALTASAEDSGDEESAGDHSPLLIVMIVVGAVFLVMYFLGRRNKNSA